MIDKLFIATHNIDKLKEINDIFKKNNLNISILSPLDFDDHDNPIEDGLSFKENAYIKANYFKNKYNLTTIGEDSGLCIEYLNNYPGIYSKRFLDGFDYKTKNDKIIQLMNHVKNRKACFITVISYININNEIHYFEGKNIGEIALKQAGNYGFGYDPIFYIKEYNKTEAELGDEYKNEYSHRAKAFKEFIKYVKEN